MVATLDVLDRGLFQYVGEATLEPFEHAAVGFHWLGLDGRVRWANRAQQEMLGYRADELVGAHAFDVHADHEVAARLLRDLARGGTTRGVPGRLRRRDGGLRHVLISSGPCWRDGELAGAHCFTQDAGDGPRGGADAAAAEALSAVRRELKVARQIQLSILPTHPPAVPGLEIAGLVRPAADCSGDFLDYLSLPTGAVGVALGDVSGHGLGPALVAAQTSTCLRTLARMYGRIDHLLTEANSLVFQSTPPETFATLAMLAFDPLSNALHYVNAGHPSGLLFDAAGNLKASLESGDVPLAVAADTHYRLDGPVVLCRGDLVVLASDGLLEAWSPDEDVFGSARLRELVRAHRHLPAAELVEAVYTGVRAFGGWGTQHDDMSVVAVRALGGA